MSDASIDAIVDYEDPYVQPIILEALKSQLPTGAVHFVSTTNAETAQHPGPLLQIRSYESIDFELGVGAKKSLFNAYVIRKAIIRKHFLSNTIHSWVTKHQDSDLRNHFTPAFDFELDYAEFLDDALIEAFELRASLSSNEALEPAEREWWILKPGMSDRGQGIRLFSSESELQSIFERWEEENPDSDDEDGQEVEEHGDRDYIMTSHLRHFIAQPYIHPPLLIAEAPFNNRKFHIRTYIVAAGALRVYVYKHMLALFASEPYHPPWESQSSPADADEQEQEGMLRKLRNIHLTNTCVQTTSLKLSAGNDNTSSPVSEQQRVDSVHLLSDLPISAASHASVVTQIHNTTGELFRAALAHPTHFQPLPQAFEIFGLDFLLDAHENVWLLEVNAFPDFAQTGEKLADKVIRGLFEEVVSNVVRPFFDMEIAKAENAEPRLTKVLDVDLGRD